MTIAIALANEPRLLLADEPTTALDVTVQHQILTLLARLAADHHMALLLVTHDQAVVREWTDEVAVMYAGQIIERGATADVLDSPRHRYTRALLESVPRFDMPPNTRLASIEGQPPSLLKLPVGCRFAARCRQAEADCLESDPGTARIDRGHSYSCRHPGEGPVEVVREGSDGR